MEIKILIEAPELAASLNNLAAAVSNFGEIKVQPVVAAPVANPTVQQPMTAAPVTSVSQTIPPVTTDSPATEQPAPRKYTMQDIAKVGSALLDKGMMPQLSAILSEMGVQAIPQLREDQYPIVAEKLIALGGKFE